MEVVASCEIFVSGHVQGVGYRYFTVEIATELDIKGYSKNMPDGGVYLEAEGEKEAILGFINHLWKGPRLARVSDIKVSWRDYRGIFRDFSVRH